MFTDDTFALKGGTAINLFVRDMPRLSVDLDLVLPDYSLERDQALQRIGEAVRQAADRLERRGFATRIAADAGETKLFVRRGKVEVKIEVNFVMRGTVHPVRRARITPKARDILLADLEIPVVSIEDVYGGKLVAAMDRQHPRDLFDVLQLLKHEGISPAIRRAFVVYLASHNRPVHEVLFPTLRDIGQDFARNFDGMTVDPVSLETLLDVRERMLDEIQHGLDADERRFLLSLVAGEPEWPVLGIPHLEHLPGIRWKLSNLTKLQRPIPENSRSSAKFWPTGCKAAAPHTDPHESPMLETCMKCAQIKRALKGYLMSVPALLDMLEAVHQPGTSDLSAIGVAKLFGLQLQDLAAIAAIHRNTIRTHPDTPRLQAVLRNLMRVLSAASVVQPDRNRALFLIKNAPIPAFRHKTILQLVAEGRTDDAIDYLESVSSGFAG